MKHIGIVGVTSEGAALCYRDICRESFRRLGEHRHPEISMHHRPFTEILAAQEERNWGKVAGYLLDSIGKLHAMGADFAIIPANSVHYALTLVRHKSPIPVISVVETACDACMEQGFKRVAVLGVGLTVSGGLYSEPLEQRGIEYRIPPSHDLEAMDQVIYHEIVPGKITEKGRERVLRVLNKMEDDCDAAILACTELALVINKENAPVPVLDTTHLLALAAVDEALK